MSLQENMDREAREAIAAIAGQANANPVDDATEDVSHLFEPLTKQELLSCVFSSWYPKFRQMTFKSEIIKPLDPSFIDYLLADGIYLPGGAGEMPRFKKDPASGIQDQANESDSDDWSSWASDNEEDNKVKILLAPIEDTVQEIRHRIDKLGGESVFPRMNWSAPKDAVWTTATNTLQCETPSQILHLLKSSDKVSTDLLSRQAMSEPELVLRQWANLVPSMEFRCFVKNRKLIAISQIDYQYYEFLELIKGDIEYKLQGFFDTCVHDQFPSESYCFDVYMAKTNDRIYVVDFEPWAYSVDSCLYSWKELLEVGKDTTEQTLGLRLFPKGVHPLGHFASKYAVNRLPLEMTLGTFEDTMKALVESVAIQDGDSSSGDEDEQEDLK